MERYAAVIKKIHPPVSDSLNSLTCRCRIPLQSFLNAYQKAFQSKPTLLALNAAIESGKERVKLGRGFAVVADEVK